MPAGRPTDYRPEYCETVLEYMGKGYSKTATAGKIGVSRQTLLAWEGQFPEFLVAVKRGEAMRTAKLEEDLLSAETGPQVTSRIFALKNAAPDEWRDKVTVAGPGDNGEHTVKIEADAAFARFASRLASLAPGATGGADGEG